MVKLPVAKNPLILRFHRLMEAFAKSDDERDFYLDKVEGFLLFGDLDKSSEELDLLEEELVRDMGRYLLIPKMTFYETKKFMEGFVNEKVYDIDTKEKLLDIIQSKEARENFLEFIYDHLTELEKWQQYYNERSRIKVIEWLREQDIVFVFEEDLDLGKTTVEKLKRYVFDDKVPRDVQQARNVLTAKAKTYYSSEALNPRPKRGRPPKQAQKVELEPQLTVDIYTTVPSKIRHFLFMPEYSSSALTFSQKFETIAEMRASLKGSSRIKIDTKLEALSQRLESLRHLSARLRETDQGLASEDRLIEAVSQQVSPEKENKVLGIVKEFLPKKRGRPKKDEIQEMIQKKKKAGIKRVTQIHRKKGKS